MFSSISQIALGIIGLSIVVLVHEGGHYLASKLAGIKVETFSIGFGRRLIGFKKGDTDYRISLIPLGGYCRFYGEQSFRTAIEEKLDYIPGEKGEFYAASPLKRIFVSFSGPLANLIFAAVVFTMISLIGFQEYYTEPKIILASGWSESIELWPADTAGLQDGDYIISVDNTEVQRFNDLRRLLIFRPDENISLTVQRNKRNIPLIIKPRLDKQTGTAIIGVLNWIDPLVSDNTSNGIMAGDRILAINGIEIPHTVAFYRILQNLGDEPFTLQINRNGRNLKIPVISSEKLGNEISFQIHSRRSIRLNPYQALLKGTQETYDTLYSTVKGLRMLFMGIEIQNAVSGPIRLI
ncbi:MAG: RIP metalloprotease RseP, partial [Spirochaetaceae bacterium]|nr:RIP metalloprotease RseP [Spirochaetaceae bacterium]